jgi:uncharacterized membrane protein HdeD (DUF308 family)
MLTNLKLLNYSETKLIAIKGILCAVFGLVCIISIFLEDKNFTILAYTLGIFTLVSGLISLITIVHEKVGIRHFSMFHYEGIASFIIGVLILGFPQTAISIFMSILGGIAMGIGLMQIALAFDLKTYKIKEGLLIYSGILTVLLGAILFSNPNSISHFVSILLGLFFTSVGTYVAYFSRKSMQQKEELENNAQQIITSLPYQPVKQK